MNNVNDCMFATVGGNATTNDGLRLFYLAHGATGGSMPDLERQYLAANVGDDDGTNNDLWMRFLGDPIVSQDPVIISTPVTEAVQDALYQYNVVATAPEPSETISYSLVTSPAGMSIVAQTGMISWMPDSGDLNANPVTVRVTDSANLTTDQAFSVYVSAYPVIVSTPVTTVVELDAYTYTVVATDANAVDDTVYSLDTALAGMSIDPDSGVITWDSEGVGDHAVTARATDQHGLSDTQAWNIDVTVQTPGQAEDPDLLYSQALNTIVNITSKDGDAAINELSDRRNEHVNNPAAGTVEDAFIGTWRTLYLEGWRDHVDILYDGDLDSNGKMLVRHAGRKAVRNHNFWGRRAVYTEVTSDKPRCDLGQPNTVADTNGWQFKLKNNNRYYIGVAKYLPENYEFDVANNGDMVLEIFSGHESVTGEIFIAEDQWRVQHRVYTNGEPYTKLGEDAAVIPAVRGEWIDWVIETYISRTDDGYIKFFANGELLLHATGFTITDVDDANGGVPVQLYKWYKPHWYKRVTGTNQADRTIVQAEARIIQTDDDAKGWNAVDPSILRI